MSLCKCCARAFNFNAYIWYLYLIIIGMNEHQYFENNRRKSQTNYNFVTFVTFDISIETGVFQRTWIKDTTLSACAAVKNQSKWYV